MATKPAAEGADAAPFWQKPIVKCAHFSIVWC